MKENKIKQTIVDKQRLLKQPGMSRLMLKSAKRAPLFDNLRGLGGLAKMRVGSSGSCQANGAPPGEAEAAYPPRGARSCWRSPPGTIGP
jgi:hypothetical protein